MADGGGHALAPMPGIVDRILVQKGDIVKVSDTPPAQPPRSPFAVW